MKKIFITFIIFIFSISAFAQNEETIFNGNLESGGFGGPVLKITQINKTTALLIGGKGGWIINHVFIIGGGGYGLITKIIAENPYGINFKMEMGYGGLDLEYVYRSNSMFHFTAGLLIGAGGVQWRENYSGDFWDYNGDGNHYAEDAFFILEPAINVELNLTTWFRLNLGGSYRVVTGVDSKLNYGGNNIKTLKNSDLSGFSGTVAFKFGLF